MENLQSEKPGNDVVDVVTIPVVEEQLVVDKINVQTGKIVVTKSINSEQEEIKIPLTAETTSVERIPLNEYVDSIPQTRIEGNVTIIPVVKEVLVVEKKLLLYEEIRITKSTKEHIESISETIRKQSADIYHVNGE